MNIIKSLFFVLAIAIGSLFIASCQNRSGVPTLKVAATSVPHALILDQIKPLLKEEGITLEVIVIDDYQLPNRALADGEVDANFFQHVPFLELQNREFGYGLQRYGDIHLEPLGLYSSQIKSLADVPFDAIVAVPNDPTNLARALILIEKAGLITLNQRDVTTTTHAIANNPKRLHILEIDAALLPRTLEDTQLVAIPANFALQAHLSPLSDALALEDEQSLFVNVLVIRQGEENRSELIALQQALTSEKVRQYIENTFKGAIIPIF